MSALVITAAIAAGAIGALARWAVALAFAGPPGSGRQRRLPWAVLVVNAAGSLVAGVVLGAGTALPAEWTAVVVGGFCGGLTTFSTFTVETIQLVVERRARAAVASVALNLALGVGACAAGYAVAAALVGAG